MSVDFPINVSTSRHDYAQKHCLFISDQSSHKHTFGTWNIYTLHHQSSNMHRRTYPSSPEPNTYRNTRAPFRNHRNLLQTSSPNNPTQEIHANNLTITTQLSATMLVLLIFNSLSAYLDMSLSLSVIPPQF
jgi:hypothetical protein